MLRGTVYALRAALRSERGFLGAVSTVAETGGGLIGAIGGLFGGGKDGEAFGKEYHTSGGFNPAGLAAAWNNATAAGRQQFMQAIASLKHLNVDPVETPGSTAWLGFVNRLANGGHDGKFHPGETAVRQAADAFVARWANVSGASGVGSTSTIPVQPAGGITTAPKPSTGERVDQIIQAIEGRPQQEIAVEPAKPLAAGFDLSNPVVLVALGGAAFLLFQAVAD